MASLTDPLWARGQRRVAGSFFLCWERKQLPTMGGQGAGRGGMVGLRTPDLKNWEYPQELSVCWLKK